MYGLPSRPRKTPSAASNARTPCAGAELARRAARTLRPAARTTSSKGVGSAGSSTAIGAKLHSQPWVHAVPASRVASTVETKNRDSPVISR
ncbi:hypothetical protein [Gordonia sp. HS-NH1]|uniref:hypothetical protein n=1 Tax=Gordonia sp. HS-NH1 TaxID=1435068 RepID=UPI0006E28EE5|nr:hypothetical protein [Gordonia sp. HS-NH1]